MNTIRIRKAANEIERYTKALEWLQQYGVKITKDSEEDIKYYPNFAGSCGGSKEAASVLCEMMNNRLPDLIKDAIKNCENTIEIYRQSIIDEARPRDTEKDNTE